MASSLRISTVFLLLSFINTVVITAVPEHEHYALVDALRFRGYHLFANAITTTDIHYDIINSANLTFFAPIDSALYNLDMIMSPAEYTTALRFHCIPHRLSRSDIQSLPYGENSFPSLVSGHDVHIDNPLPLPLPLPITAEGVDIAFPDVYYDKHIVVHGLEGVMDFRSVIDSSNSSSSSTNAHAPLVTVHHEAHAPSLSVYSIDHAPSMSMYSEDHAPTSQFEGPIASTPTRSTIVSGIDTTASPVPSSSLSPSHHHPEMKSESITQPRLPESYFESTTQPREEHISTSMRSDFSFQKINAVSFASKSAGNDANEFIQVDNKISQCPVTENGDEQLKIANIRRGDNYVPELYSNRFDMTCVHE